MILSVSGLTFKGYLANSAPVRQEEYACPLCGRRLSWHDSFSRGVRFGGGQASIVEYRLRCRPCHRTFTLQPDFLRPRQRYLAAVREESIENYCTSPDSYRKVAVAVSGAPLPSGVSPTDALLHSVHPRPSFQRVFDWVRDFAGRAEGLCQDLLAWCIRLQPDHDALHQLAVSSDALRSKAKSDSKRDQLRACAVLLAILHGIGALHAADLGWQGALDAFERRVLGRIPGPGPPLPHFTGREVPQAAP